MSRGAPADAGAADDRSERLERAADCAIALHALVAALPASHRDALRQPVNRVLAEIGRCVARQLDTPHAPESGEAPPRRIRRMSA